MEISKIFENNEKWIQEKTEDDPAYFENLNKGQKPNVLYIGCSDSRVTAEDLMGMQTGSYLCSLIPLALPMKMNISGTKNRLISRP